MQYTVHFPGNYGEDERGVYEDAKDRARARYQRNRDELHKVFTEEAVAWLAARAVQPQRIDIAA